MTFQALLDEDMTRMTSLYMRCISWINSIRNTVCPGLIPLKPEKINPSKEELAQYLHQLCTLGWYVSMMSWETKIIDFESLDELDLKLSLRGV